MKQAFHRSAENMKASLDAVASAAGVTFFDRDGDGKHTFADQYVCMIWRAKE